MAFHAHVLPNQHYLVHSHGPSGDVHLHSKDEIRLPPLCSEHGHLHEHELAPSGLRVRHVHISGGHSQNKEAQGDSQQHKHGEEAIVVSELLPPRPVGWRMLFPAWTVPHPWWHIWPLPEIRPSHAKAHFNSSAVDDLWPGSLTNVTQGFKIGMALTAWFVGRDDPDTFQGVIMPIAISIVTVFLAACWIHIWSHSRINVLLTVINYVVYINGWTLSVLVVCDRTKDVFGIPDYWGLLPTLGPPAYVTLRTMLFLPSVERRRRFLLAALSNRAVPLELNFHVVGPKDTFKSHAFLTMLNTWAMGSTLVAKIVVFIMEPPTALGVTIHCVHLLSTWWASLYGIRCRQITIDCFRAAEAQPILDNVEPVVSTVGHLHAKD